MNGAQFNVGGDGASHAPGADQRNDLIARTLPALCKIFIHGAADVGIQCGKPRRHYVCGTSIAHHIIVVKSKRGNELLIQTGLGISDLSDGTRGKSRSACLPRIALELGEVPEVCLCGNSRLIVKDVRQEQLEIKMNGAGQAALTGEVGRLVATIVGSGEVRASQLQARSAKLSVTGDGTIEAVAKDNLHYHNSGSGHILVRGKHKISGHSRNQGSGTVRSQCMSGQQAGRGQANMKRH